MVRGHMNWYREAPKPPGKTGLYIYCPNCQCVTSRKNINTHMKSQRCMYFDVHQEHEIFDGQYNQLPELLCDSDDWYVWNYVYNNIIEYKLIYPLYLKLLHF